MSNDQKDILRDSLSDADLFTRAFLRMHLYDWQGKILYRASQDGKRRRLAVRAPNGSGKSERIVAPLILWWLCRYHRGQVVLTTADQKQLSGQSWVALSAHRQLFGSGWKWRDHDHVIETPTGGRLSAWVTDEAKRAEGYHEREPDGPLLMIVDEAKSVPDEIFDAFNRCSYNLLLEISTGGLMQGAFYRHMAEQRDSYECFEITLQDCPHISKEKIDQIIAEYGENDPYTRSTIFGEFMSADDSVRHILELTDIESNRNAQIGRRAGPVTAGVDFAAGGDFNVIIKRLGNYVPAGGIKAWRQKDTHAAVGLFIHHFNELELKPEQIWADADGLGLPMCDALRAAGWNVNRFHGGSNSPHSRYKNLIAYAWNETAAKIKRHEIIVPNDQKLIAQLSTRRIKYEQSGKLAIESKVDMRARGLESPDLADAFCMAFSVQQAMAYSWLPYDDSRFREIAEKHGWDWTSSAPDNDESYADRRTWNRPPPDDTSGSGFGGCWTTW